MRRGRLMADPFLSAGVYFPNDLVGGRGLDVEKMELIGVAGLWGQGETDSLREKTGCILREV